MKTLLTVMVATLFSGSVFAAGYGSAGCGLGSMILGSEKGFTQVFASTTNGSSGSQTFGISSGTSNCGSGGKTATQFIEVNKAALGNDIARGEGETISALSEIYGCSNLDSFSSTLKSNYEKIFKEQESSQVNKNIIKIMNEEKITCNALV